MTVRDELAEATNHINQLVPELSSIKLSCKEKQGTSKLPLIKFNYNSRFCNILEEILKLSITNKTLNNQIQELLTTNTKREKQIDEFSEALDIRVKEWKVCIYLSKLFQKVILLLL